MVIAEGRAVPCAGSFGIARMTAMRTILAAQDILSNFKKYKIPFFICKNMFLSKNITLIIITPNTSLVNLFYSYALDKCPTRIYNI